MACVYDKNGSEAYKTFLDKYFEKNYKIVTQDEGDHCKESEDYCILKHSNKVCVLMLASGHSLLKEQKDIIEVDFQITPTTNRMDNKVIGKSKRGAQWLTNESPICLVRCSDGTQYTLKSCVPGKLLEVNQKLSKEPMLLARKPLAEGYLAVILPKVRDWNTIASSFVSQEDYNKILEERQRKGTKGD